MAKGKDVDRAADSTASNSAAAAKVSEVLTSFNDAYEALLRALADTITPADADERLDEVRKRFEEIGNDPVKYFEAYRVWAETVGEVWNPKEILERIESAYRDYLRATAEAWSGADVEKLQPVHLAAIGQSEIQAANVVVNAATYWSQFG